MVTLLGHITVEGAFEGGHHCRQVWQRTMDKWALPYTEPVEETQPGMRYNHGMHVANDQWLIKC